MKENSDEDIDLVVLIKGAIKIIKKRIFLFSIVFVIILGYGSYTVFKNPPKNRISYSILVNNESRILEYHSLKNIGIEAINAFAELIEDRNYESVAAALGIEDATYFENITFLEVVDATKNGQRSVVITYEYFEDNNTVEFSNLLLEFLNSREFILENQKLINQLNAELLLEMEEIISNSSIAIQFDNAEDLAITKDNEILLKVFVALQKKYNLKYDLNTSKSYYLVNHGTSILLTKERYTALIKYIAYALFIGILIVAFMEFFAFIKKFD